MSDKEHGSDYINWETFRTTREYKLGLLGSLHGVIVAEMMTLNPGISEEAVEGLDDIVRQKVVDLETAKKFCEDSNPKIEIDFDQVIKRYEDGQPSSEKFKDKLLKEFFPDQANKGKIN